MPLSVMTICVNSALIPGDKDYLKNNAQTNRRGRQNAGGQLPFPVFCHLKQIHAAVDFLPSPEAKKETRPLISEARN